MSGTSAEPIQQHMHTLSLTLTETETQTRAIIHHMITYAPSLIRAHTYTPARTHIHRDFLDGMVLRIGKTWGGGRGRAEGKREERRTWGSRSQ